MKIQTAIITFFSVLLIVGCSYKTVPLKGVYQNGNYEAFSDKPQEEVWSNLIDFFAKSGLSIKIIDKSSGLLVSDAIALSWTFENKKGQPNKPDASVIVAQVIDPGTKKPLIPFLVTAEWNVRLKTINGKTSINVNLVNPRYYNSPTDAVYKSFKSETIRSLGNFEKKIADAIK
ncbi:hypothetical protein JMG10_34015 [Nostoc ellipsosporum NOK]|nr:hypothetical protein [Nostoc ellipsosporum NOK]